MSFIFAANHEYAGSTAFAVHMECNFSLLLAFRNY